MKLKMQVIILKKKGEGDGGEIWSAKWECFQIRIT